MGIDIKPGYSPRSSREPRYAVVIIKNGSLVREVDDVPLHSVVRLILEYHVNVLAVDSIQEIAESRRDVARLSRIIPSWCKLVEVTWRGNEYVSVQELARILKVGFEATDPLKTALVNAYAALSGFGKEISLHSDYTYVVVTKGRTPAQGGASAERFKRSIRASILQLVKEVKNKLDETGLEYDLVVKKSSGGLERGVFIVYAPVEKVRDIVTPLKYRNVKIIIKPVPPRKPMAKARRPVIIGVDPGTSIGLAILDLDGKPVLVTSLRSPDREKLIELISSKGKPVLIAVDTSKPPDYVKKVSSAINVPLYTPERDLSIDEKQKMISEYSSAFNIDIPDAHARDALAAALKAYKLIKPLVDEVESKIRGISGVERDVVVVEVLKGKPLSTVLEEAFAKILTRKNTGMVVYEKVKEKTCPDLEKLQIKQQELEATIKKLEQELKLKDEIIRSLELELKLATRRGLDEECERRINQLKTEMEYLRRSLEEKAKLVEVLSEKSRKLEDILAEAVAGRVTIAIKNPRDKCPDQFIYIDNPREVYSYVECARSSKTAILVPRNSKIDWKELRVPVVEVDVLYDAGNYVVVYSNVLDAVRDMWRWIEEIEAQERRERILKMIKEYQESRRRGL